MKKTKRITFISFISPLSFSVLTFLLIVTLNLFFWDYNNNSYLLFMPVTVLFLLIFLIPAVILQFNYHKFDKKTLLTIDDSIDSAILINNEKEFSFKLSDIDRVRIIQSMDYNGLWRSAPWNSYYFYLICLKNDDEYLVTRLIDRKLEKLLNVRVVRQIVFFPFITEYFLNRAKNKYDKTSA